MAITHRFDGIEDMHRRIAQEIMQFDRPAQKSLSELSGAALCIALGATGGKRIARERGARTPDWLLHFEPSCLVEVEVTAADPKVDQLDRGKFASAIATAVRAKGRIVDIVAYILDPTTASDRDEVLEAASTIEAGQMRQRAGRWQVRGRPASAELDLIFSSDDLRRPDWWPAQEKICGILHSVIDDVSPTRCIPPRISIYFALSDQTLLTTVRTKAERSQGTSARPILLAVDVSLLPNGMQKIPELVVPFFPQWDHVAGVLLFQQWHPEGRIGWRWRLLMNVHATRQLPSSLTAGRSDRTATSTLEFLLSSKGSILQPE